MPGKRKKLDAQVDAPDLATMYPVLRDGIEPISFQTKNGDFRIALRDGMGINSHILWLSEDLFYILQFFNGLYSCQEIKSRYFKRYQTFLFDEQLTQLLDHLDANYFLLNERSEQKIKKKTEEYRSLPAREPVCSGTSYAADAAQLNKELEEYRSVALNQSAEKAPRRNGEITAIVAPHIDIRLGGATYAHAYNALENSQPADLYVILGTGHKVLRNHIALTTKSYRTPLGLVETDADVAERIVKKANFDFFEDELMHQNEHTIEFQCLFLQHYIKSSFKILPVLCSFSHYVFKYEDSAERQMVTLFIDSLKAVLKEFDGTVCFIASVDLAHIGPRYGDRNSPDHHLLAQCERNDRELLHAVCQLDDSSFQNLIEANDNRYRICGYAPLMILMKTLCQSTGELLSYASAVVDEKKSSVTFASAIFSGNSTS
jgi:AmmeMemoRadiSam system protein B